MLRSEERRRWLGSARMGSEIAAPHGFGFQRRHYVIAPEVRAKKLGFTLRGAFGRATRPEGRLRGQVRAAPRR